MGVDKNLNAPELNTDTENVKPKLHEFIHTIKLIIEFYINLSTSDTYDLII